MRPTIRRLAQALTVAVFTANVYRAWTQSITVDEAQTFNELVSGPVSRMFGIYDANHHVLHTYLCRVSVGLLGASEFSMRLPSLMGGLLYLLMVYRLCFGLLGEGLPALFTVGMLALDPLIMDHLSVARGYGLGLGLCLWGLYELTRYAAKPAHGSLHRAALAFGLSISANLAYLLPTAGLGAAFLLVAAREGRLRAAILHFAFPAAALAALIAGPPLRTATSATFYVGTDSWFESFERMFRDSFFNAVDPWLSIAFSPRLVTFAARVLMPALIGAGILAAIAAGRRWWRKGSWEGLDARDRFVYLAGGAMGFIFVANTLLWWTTRTMYPEPRAGLYWVVLMTLTAPVLMTRLPYRALRRLGFAALGVCAVHFAFQWNVSDYREWRFDRRTKDIIRLIEQREAARGHGHVRVGATWLLAPSLNFYRTTRRLSWMEPVNRNGPDGPYDYYVLWDRDRSLAKKYALTPLLEDEIAAVLLAAREP